MTSIPIQGGISAVTYSLLIGTPMLVAVGQMLFKTAGERLTRSGDAFYTLLLDPVMIAACVLYAGATLLWVQALRMVPLSFAYSFMALTFVTVPILSVFFLGETVTLKHWAGIGLIIVGLFVVQS